MLLEPDCIVSIQAIFVPVNLENPIVFRHLGLFCARDRQLRPKLFSADFHNIENTSRLQGVIQRVSPDEGKCAEVLCYIMKILVGEKVNGKGMADVGLLEDPDLGEIN